MEILQTKIYDKNVIFNISEGNTYPELPSTFIIRQIDNNICKIFITDSTGYTLKPIDVKLTEDLQELINTVNNKEQSLNQKITELRNELITKIQESQTNIEQKESSVKIEKEYQLISVNVNDNQQKYNTKVVELLEKLLPLPNYVGPSLHLSSTTQILHEVGTNPPITIVSNFTKNDAGNPTSHIIYKDNNPVKTVTTNNNTFTENIRVQSIASFQYRSRCEYGEGNPKENSIGIVVPKGKITAGGLNSSPTSLIVTFSYPTFYGTIESNQSINNINLGNLTKLIIYGGTDIVCNYNFSGKRMVIVTLETKNRWFVSELNKGTIGNAGDLFSAKQNKVFNSPSNLWSDINYNVYISSPTSLTGTLRLQS